MSGPMTPYRAVRESIGLLDRSGRGIIRVTGSDRITWLQGMVSNDMRPIEQGAPRICACVLNATGHLLADIAVVNGGDHLLLDMERENAPKIAALLDRYIIMEDVEIEECSDTIGCLSLQGPGVERGWARAQAGESALMAEADHTGAGGVDIYLPSEEASALRERLMEAGIPLLDEETAETLRIEAGIPRYGVDMDESIIPLEANLEATHISHTKGCYVGQEIIARIHSRGHTNRALTGLLLEGDTRPVSRAKIYPAEGETEREVGWITSVAYSPALGRLIALGYVRHERRAPGTALSIETDGVYIPAQVTPLPFVGKKG